MLRTTSDICIHDSIKLCCVKNTLELP